MKLKSFLLACAASACMWGAIITTGIALLQGCQKEQQQLARDGDINSPTICEFDLDYQFEQRPFYAPVKYSHIKKTRNILFLDFDGHVNTYPYWGVTTLLPSGLNAQQQQAIFDTMVVCFSSLPIIVTTDSTIFANALPDRRQRIVFTQSWEWYGQVGGVAYVNSFKWIDDSPAFVFTSLLGFTNTRIGKAAAHEAGHTLGCLHQSDCVNGSNVNQYSPNKIMGFCSASSQWSIGTNQYCGMQDDLLTMAQTLTQ